MDINDIQVYVNGVLQISGFSRDIVHNRINFTIAPAAGTVVDLVRQTSPTIPLGESQTDTNNRLSYFSEEARDTTGVNDWTNLWSMNSDGLQVAEVLPDADEGPSSIGVNSGGWNTARFRFQATSAQLTPKGFPFGWWSAVIKNPTNTPTKKNTYSALSVFLKGYQGDQNKPQSSSSLISTAMTGLGQMYGKAEGFVVTAAHEDGRANVTLGDTANPTNQDAQVTVFAIHSGIAGNNLTVRIRNPGTAHITVTLGATTEVDVFPATGSTTAAAIATIINTASYWTTAGSAQLMVASTPGDGTASPSVMSSAVPLTGGGQADGKLVGVQSIVTPRTDAGGNLLPTAPRFDVYGYAANSNGEYPAFGAFIAKAKDDPGDQVDSGWYNGFIVDDGGSGHTASVSIRLRAYWYFNNFVITARDSVIPQPTGSNSTTRKGVWMGLGTDYPDAPIHLQAPANPSGSGYVATTADIKIELTSTLSTGGDLSKINYVGNTGSSKEMARLTVNMLDATSASEDAQFEFYTIKAGGALASPQWHLADTIWADGTAQPTAAGSLNATHLFQNGVPVPGLSASVTGNVTLNATSPSYQVVNANLTGTPVITLPTGSASLDGLWFRVTRTPSGTGVSLSVKSGATLIKNLAFVSGATVFADFVYSAALSAWYVAATNTAATP